MEIFRGFLFPTALTSILADIIPMLGTLFAAVKLHKALLHGVMRASLLFFDTTPMGRILARFSKDVEELDNNLPYVVVDGIYCLLEVSKFILQPASIDLLCILLELIFLWAENKLLLELSRNLYFNLHILLTFWDYYWLEENFVSNIWKIPAVQFHLS